MPMQLLIIFTRKNTEQRTKFCKSMELRKTKKRTILPQRMIYENESLLAKWFRAWYAASAIITAITKILERQYPFKMYQNMLQCCQM